MASTSPTEVSAHNGFTTLPGLKLGPYAAAITNLKAYSFTCADTAQISATSTERSYTINGLTTDDFPLTLVFSTGTAVDGVAAGNLRVGAANTLNVTWATVGTATAGVPGNASGVLITTQIISLASSTTT